MGKTMRKQIVTVYSFTKYDPKSDRQIVSAYKATEEAIHRFEAVRIDGTGEELDASLLDAEGRYRPKN
jgi:hypothetical protein